VCRLIRRHEWRWTHVKVIRRWRNRSNAWGLVTVSVPQGNTLCAGRPRRIAFGSWPWRAYGLLSYWHDPDRMRRARHRDLLARCEVWCSRVGDRHGVGVLAPHGDFPSWAALAYLF